MTPELSRLIGRVVNGPLLIALGPREQRLLTATSSKAHSVDGLPGRQRILVRAHLRAFPGDEVEDHVGHGVLGSPAHNVENYDKDEPRGQGGRWASGAQYDKAGRVTSSIDPHEHVQIHDSATGEIYWHGPRHEAEDMLREQSEVEPGNTLRIVPYDQSAHTAQQSLEEVRRRQHDEAAAETQRQESLRTPFGLLPGHRDYVEPPSTLYHATLDPDKITTGGFKSSDELGYQTLGGSSSHLVSFTTKANAEKYAQALDTSRKAAQGKLGDADLVKVGQRYGVSEEKMQEILDRTEGARDKSFSVLQAVSMEGKQFPLFMGTSWPQHLKTAGPPALVSVPSSDVKSIYYNPGEHEWRLGDLSNLNPTLVRNEDPSRFGLLPAPPPPVFVWADESVLAEQPPATEALTQPLATPVSLPPPVVVNVYPQEIHKESQTETENFDPNQPRGEHGLWSKGESSAGTGLGSAMDKALQGKDEKFHRAISEASAGFSKVCRDRIAANLLFASFHKDPEALTVALGRDPSKRLCKGCFTSEGELHLCDNGDMTSPIACHELHHVIDLVPYGSHTYSDKPAWRDLWQKEIVAAPEKMSEHADVSASEGFAEFGRLIHTSGLTRGQVASRFPGCYRFFDSEGLL